MSRTPETEFRRRALMVDADEGFLKGCADAFRNQNVEVLTAQDGFEALRMLRGGIPDLLISALTLPHMSGFELLSVVRTRFPQIAVIATSDEYTALNLPTGTIADAFVPKGANAIFELVAAMTNSSASRLCVLRGQSRTWRRSGFRARRLAT